MTFPELFVLILASYRLTHLMIYDAITKGLRSRFMTVQYIRQTPDTVIRQVNLKGEGWRRKTGELLSCQWCLGIWCAAVVVGLYYFFPGTFVLWLILAVAGSASIIESFIMD